MPTYAHRLREAADILAPFNRGQANVLHRIAADLRFATSAVIDARLRTKVNHDLGSHGMDGNRTFRSVGMGLAAIGEVLSHNGLEWDTTLNAHLFMGDSGRRTLDIAMSNPADSFSPTSVSNSILSFSWYKHQSGNYEITAYLS